MGWQLSFPAQLSHYLSQAVAMSAEMTAPLSPSRFMASKRYRWTALAALLTIFFVFFLVKNHDALPQRLPQGIPSTYTYTGGDVDWSRFAYTQYVTNSEYLCNSVMFFESLHRLSSKADRVMMFPSRMLKSEDDESSDARLLIKARDKYNVKLVPITIQHRDNADSTWADSFTKLLAFNQTQYSRVLSIDSDSLLLQPMDELFLLPSVPVAMPRAYWLWPDKEILSSQVVLIEPSDVEFKRIQDKIKAASGDDYDMEIVNYLYRDSALVLPHRRYDLLTGEFRGDNHSKYLGSDVEVWDPATAYSEAKLVHFSDWPLPKPWLATPEDIRIKIQPDCKNTTEGLEDCTARIIWNSFYTDFKTKREEVCGDGDDDAKPSQAAR